MTCRKKFADVSLLRYQEWLANESLSNLPASTQASNMATYDSSDYEQDNRLRFENRRYKWLNDLYAKRIDELHELLYDAEDKANSMQEQLDSLKLKFHKVRTASIDTVQFYQQELYKIQQEKKEAMDIVLQEFKEWEDYEAKALEEQIQLMFDFDADELISIIDTE